MSDDFEQLFAEAEAELEQDEIHADWGYERPVAEGERVLTRYLGTDLLPPFNDAVYRFVSYPGTPEPFYLRLKTRLVRAMDEASPAVGDVVALVRGKDQDIGKPYPMQTWSARARSCDEPLTGRRTAADDIPF